MSSWKRSGVLGVAWASLGCGGDWQPLLEAVLTGAPASAVEPISSGATETWPNMPSTPRPVASQAAPTDCSASTSSCGDVAIAASVVSGPSPFASDCGGPDPALDPETALSDFGENFPGTRVEPHLVADPTDPTRWVGIWQQDRWSLGGARGLVARRFESSPNAQRDSDGPRLSRCSGGEGDGTGDYARASDPWLSFAPDGTLYASGLAFEPAGGGGSVWVARSLDGGAHFEPAQVLSTSPSDDKPSITVDPQDARFAYATWTRGSIGYFRRTTDAGFTWEPEREMEGVFVPLGNVIVVTGDGTLLSTFSHSYRSDGSGRVVGLLRSSDRGASWSQVVDVTDVSEASNVVPELRTQAVTPSFAADPRRGQARVYAAWQDGGFSSAGSGVRVVVARSEDGGLSWSEPGPVSAEGWTAFNPTLAVNALGQVVLTFYAFDATEAQRADRLNTNVWAVHSDDGGQTFSVPSRLTPEPFDFRAAPLANGYFLGDYFGLAGTDEVRAFFPVARFEGDQRTTDLLLVPIPGVGSNP